MQMTVNYLSTQCKTQQSQYAQLNTHSLRCSTESTFIASAIQSKTHLYLIVHAIYMYELLRRVHLLFARVHQMQNVNHYKTICNGLVCFRVKLFRIPL